MWNSITDKYTYIVLSQSYVYGHEHTAYIERVFSSKCEANY